MRNVFITLDYELHQKLLFQMIKEILVVHCKTLVKSCGVKVEPTYFKLDDYSSYPVYIIIAIT